MARSGNFWSEELEPTLEAQKQNGDTIVVKKVRKGDKWFIDVRNWYVAKSDFAEGSELNAGKGIAIPIDMAGDIADAIFRALESSPHE